MPVVPSMKEGMASTLVPRKRLKVVTRMVERAMQTIIVRLKSAFMGLNRNLSTSTPNAAATRTVRGKATNPGRLKLDHQQIAAIRSGHEDGAVGQVEDPQQVEDEREAHAHEDVDHPEQDHVDHCLNCSLHAFNQSPRLSLFCRAGSRPVRSWSSTRSVPSAPAGSFCLSASYLSLRGHVRNDPGLVLDLARR